MTKKNSIFMYKMSIVNEIPTEQKIELYNYVDSNFEY